MAMCPLCEKKFQDRRGLHGHFRFKHGIEYGSGRPAKKTALTEATREMLERRKKERELFDRVSSGKDELSPRYSAVWKNEREPYREAKRMEGINLKGLQFAWEKEAKQSKGIDLKGLSGRWYKNGR